MNRRHFLKTIGTAVAAFSILGMSNPLPKKKPNFLIILGDDISWPSFGCENPGAFTKTPNIDKLAREGLRFSNFYCSSAVCMPVRHELS